MNRVTFTFFIIFAFVSGTAFAAERWTDSGSLFSRTLLELDSSEMPASVQVVAYLAKAEQSGGNDPQAPGSAEGFVDNGDGSITDTRTGLVWLKDAGMKAVSREKAEEYCASLRVGGYAGWRLPTEKELGSMTASFRANEKFHAKLASRGFVNVGDMYWTHIKDAPFEDFIWSVDAGFCPMTADRKHNNYVWPVRSGRTPDSK